MPEITADMAGTWLDGHMGWHNAYRVIDVAETYGFIVPEEYRDALTAYRHSANGVENLTDDQWGAVNGQGELSDKATDYLNERAPEGFEFVWDAGEFSLMSSVDAELI